MVDGNEIAKEWIVTRDNVNAGIDLGELLGYILTDLTPEERWEVLDFLREKKGGLPPGIAPLWKDKAIPVNKK